MSKERLLRLGKLSFKALITIAALLWLLWYFAPRELIEKRALPIELSPQPGREIFRIFSGQERFPKFSLAIIEPQDVKPGDVQKLTVQIEDPAGIREVIAITELDHETFKLPLELASGTPLSGYWTNAWIVRDTHSKTYRTKFIAINKKGVKNTITLAWQDGCTSPYGGDWIIAATCSIGGVDGADNGNIDIGGTYDITLLAGATLVYNPGRQIAMRTGRLIINDTAQIKEAYLFVTDADNDGYAPSTFSRTYSTSATLSGWVRRYTLQTNPFDCYDANANARPGQTGWFTVNRGDGSFDYNCNGVIEYQYGVTTDLCGCGDATMAAGYTTNPGCGVAGTYYTSCTQVGLCGSRSVDSTWNYDNIAVSRTQACR
jgi:hypothetical protein